MYFGYGNAIDNSRRTVPTHAVTENPYVNSVQKIGGKMRAKKPKYTPEQQNAAAEMIQKDYRMHNAQERLRANRPQMQRENDDFIQRQLRLCERGGQTLPMSDYSLDGWKEFYEPNDYYFTGFDKYKDGYVYETARVQNPDDPVNVKVYQGDVNLNNERHGFGTLTTPKDIKIGTWRNNEFSGWCIEGIRNGPATEARFENGIANGKGYRRTKKGDKYRGDFENNIRQGKGELDAQRYFYEGDFNSDKMDGTGKIKFKENGEEYEGDFKNNQLDGRGIFRWPNGDVYEGEMVKGKRSGNGKYRYSNGQVYEGHYNSAGKKEGKGSVIFNNGTSYNANFRQGKPEGTGELVRKGERMSIEFMNGKASRINGVETSQRLNNVGASGNPNLYGSQGLGEIPERITENAGMGQNPDEYRPQGDNIGMEGNPDGYGENNVGLGENPDEYRNPDENAGIGGNPDEYRGDQY